MSMQESPADGLMDPFAERQPPVIHTMIPTNEGARHPVWTLKQLRAHDGQPILMDNRLGRLHVGPYGRCTLTEYGTNRVLPVTYGRKTSPNIMTADPSDTDVGLLASMAAVTDPRLLTRYAASDDFLIRQAALQNPATPDIGTILQPFPAPGPDSGRWEQVRVGRATMGRIIGRPVMAEYGCLGELTAHENGHRGVRFHEYGTGRTFHAAAGTILWVPDTDPLLITGIRRTVIDTDPDRLTHRAGSPNRLIQYASLQNPHLPDTVVTRLWNDPTTDGDVIRLLAAFGRITPDSTIDISRLSSRTVRMLTDRAVTLTVCQQRSIAFHPTLDHMYATRMLLHRPDTDPDVLDEIAVRALHDPTLRVTPSDVFRSTAYPPGRLRDQTAALTQPVGDDRYELSRQAWIAIALTGTPGERERLAVSTDPDIRQAATQPDPYQPFRRLRIG